MTTRELISSIPEANKHTLEVYSDIIASSTVRGLQTEVEKRANELHGYLTCMKDAGTITEYGLRALFLWYRSARVDKTIKEGAVL